jgi:hypothetical protein
MQQYDIQFHVSRSPNRIKQVAFPGVDGRATMNLGSELFTIVQTGKALIERGITDPGNTALRELWFDDEPGLWAGTKLVTVFTGEGVYKNCRLVDVNVNQATRRIVEYQYTWQQVEPGVVHEQQENSV